MIRNIKTIYFDFDGTIHDSIKIYAPAFRKAYDYLVEQHHATSKSWSDEEIAYWLGFNKEEMWQAFMPDLDDASRSKAGQIIGNEMTRLIEEGKAVLYDGATEVLAYLCSKGFRLVFLSNCGIYYKEMVREKFDLDQYFNEMVCSEEYDFLSKSDILTKIMRDHPSEMVMIGDRYHDIEAGIKNNIVTIGCTYGYCKESELEQADYLIKDIREIMSLKINSF